MEEEKKEERERERKERKRKEKKEERNPPDWFLNIISKHSTKNNLKN